MPKTADKKPRNKWRREKYRNETSLPYVPSYRSTQRRRLRELTRDVHTLEGHIKAVLGFEGKTWRYYERVSASESQRIMALARARWRSDEAISMIGARAA